ncbi:MAG: hypothetical protein IPK46_19915 [Saprospiraceae bacterium]|nr:hypothetical protein [Saprospiraceae bacterium]
MILQKNTTYQEPESPIKEMADAELAPVIRINTKATLAFLLHRKPYKELEELAAPELKLAGLRINPKPISNPEKVIFTKSAFLIF